MRTSNLDIVLSYVTADLLASTNIGLLTVEVTVFA